MDREEPGMSCGPGLQIGAEQVRAWTGLSWVLSDRTARGVRGLHAEAGGWMSQASRGTGERMSEALPETQL